MIGKRRSVGICIVIGSCVSMSLCMADSGTTVDKRWETEGRGLVVFSASIGKESREQQVYVLHLHDRKLELLVSDSAGVPFRDLTSTKWLGQNETIGFVSDTEPFMGFQLVNRLTTEIRPMLPGGEWRHRNAPVLEFLDTTRTGFQLWIPSPGIMMRPIDWCYGHLSGKLYVAIHYQVDPGPAEWRVNTDSMDLPYWIGNPLEARLLEARQQQMGLAWVDIVAIDSLGHRSLVAELPSKRINDFAVDPMERFFAYSDLNGMYVYDIQKMKVITAIPSTWIPPIGTAFSPDGTNSSTVMPFFEPVFSPDGTTSATVIPLWGPAFSPDGTQLAAIGISENGNGLFLSSAPEFASFELVHLIPNLGLKGFCWSPDGEWILMQVLNSGFLRGKSSLMALEVETGEVVDIPNSYFLDGKRVTDLYMTTGLDWIW